MKSILIVYTGNVCSSPTLGMFQYVPQFDVRSFENFDKHKCGNRTLDDIGTALEDLHHGRDTQMTRSFGLSRNCSSKPCVVKWRPYENGPTHNLKRVLRECYTPVFLARKSLIDNCAKIIANEKVYGTRWPQFGTSTQSIELKSFDDKFKNEVVMEMEKRLKWIESMLQEMKVFYDRDIPVIYAEDIFKPMVDTSSFIKIFSDLVREPLDLNLPNNFNPGVLRIESFMGINQIKKIGVNLKEIEGYDELHSNPFLNSLDEKYLEVLSGTDKK